MKWINEITLSKGNKHKGEDLFKVPLSYLTWILKEAADGMEELEIDIIKAFIKRKEEFRDSLPEEKRWKPLRTSEESKEETRAVDSGEKPRFGEAQVTGSDEKFLKELKHPEWAEQDVPF